MADSIIKLVGIGGCGISIINSIVDKNIKGVECIAIDANKRALDISNAQKKLLIGEKSVDGLGSGGAPEVGESAAREDVEAIKELFPEKQDCIAVIVAGMGGGTGTGAAPIVAEIARKNGASTIAIVCKPFDFEGKVKMQCAEDGLKKLRESVENVITLKNQGIVTAADDLQLSEISYKDAFKIINNAANKFVQMLSELVYDDNIKGNVKFMKSIL
ncbi:MAG: hypothetical protein VZR56_03300 [Treponema sp.]|nr:hypothetical protein [Treponema sp.]